MTQRGARRGSGFNMMGRSALGTCTLRAAARSSCARIGRLKHAPPWTGGLSYEFLEARALADDGLIAFGAGGNATHFDSRARFQESDVVFGLGRQLVVVRDAERGGVPAGHVLVHGLDFRNLGHRGRHAADFLAADAIAHADRNRVDVTQHVELGHHDAVETVDGSGVAQQGRIEPAATPRTAGDRAEFFAAGADPLARAVEGLGGKGSAADARDVGLGDADDTVNARGRDTGSSAGPAGAGAGGGHEGISAVVDIEHGALRAFEHDGLAVADGVIEQHGGVADHGAYALGEGLVLGADGGEVELAIDAESPGDDDLLLHDGIVLRAENFGREEVGDADAAAGGLVLVAGADAARGGADGDAALAAFRHFLHHAMGWKQHVGAVTDEEIGGHGDAGRFQRLDLAQQRGGGDDESGGNYGLFPGGQNAARDQFEDELLLADENRVARIVATLIARHNIEAFGEEIDDLAFTLVAPLCAEDDYVSHFDQTYLLYRTQHTEHSV